MERQNLPLVASKLIDAIQNEPFVWDTTTFANEEDKELAWSHLSALFELNNCPYHYIVNYRLITIIMLSLLTLSICC